MGDHLQAPNYRIPVQFIADSFRSVAKELNDPLIGVKSGINQKAPNLGTLNNLLQTTKDLRQAIQMGTRFLEILTQSYDCSYNEDHYGANIRFSVKPGIDISHYQIDLTLTIFSWLASEIYNEPGLIMYFKHNPDIEVQKEYRKLLKPEVVFNHEFNGFYAPQAALDTKISMLSDNVFKRQLNIVQDEFDSVEGNSNIIDMVKGKIRNSSQFYKIDLNEVSEQLQIPSRTLQSQLKNKGTSFRELVTSVRLEIVEDMVAQNKAIQAIAEKTGYTDTSAFYRAFKGWTGQEFKEYFSVKNNL